MDNRRCEDPPNVGFYLFFQHNLLILFISLAIIFGTDRGLFSFPAPTE